MPENNSSYETVTWPRTAAEQFFSGMRWVAGKAVLLQNRIAALPDLNAIKNIQHAHLLPLASEPTYTVETLRAALQAATDLQTAARETTAHMKLPQPGEPMPLTDISEQIKNISLGLGKTLKGISKHKVTRDLKAAVTVRLSSASVEHMKDAKHFLHTGHKVTHTTSHHVDSADTAAADGADLADNASASISAADLGDHMNALDVKIVHVLDNTGIVGDFAHAQDVIIDVFPVTSAAMDMMGDLTLVPGIFSSGKAIIKEINMLTKKETTFEDSFQATFLPVLVKTVTLAAAIAAETATGGTFFGAIIIGTIILNAVGGKQLIKDQAMVQWNELHGYQQKIHSRKQEAFEAINDAVATNFAWLPNLLANCPALGGQQEMRAFAGAMAHAYDAEATTVSQFVLNECAKRIDRLPPPNWLDRALNIDRTAARTTLYRRTADKIVTRLNSNARQFAETAKTDTAAAIYSLYKRPVIPGGQAAKTTASLETWLPQTINRHSADVAQWQSECAGNWKTATESTAEITTRESADVTALVDRLKPCMEPLRQALRANMKRLGQEIDI